jgi:hypothetical protein
MTIVPSPRGVSTAAVGYGATRIRASGPVTMAGGDLPVSTLAARAPPKTRPAANATQTALRRRHRRTESAIPRPATQPAPAAMTDHSGDVIRRSVRGRTDSASFTPAAASAARTRPARGASHLARSSARTPSPRSPRARAPLPSATSARAWEVSSASRPCPARPAATRPTHSATAAAIRTRTVRRPSTRVLTTHLPAIARSKNTREPGPGSPDARARSGAPRRPPGPPPGVHPRCRGARE